MNKIRNHWRIDALILQRLAVGTATTDELAKAVYGDSDYYARRSLWVAIHRLRKKGVDIINESAGDWQSDWQQYRLGSMATCPYCGGTGMVAPCDGEGKSKA